MRAGGLGDVEEDMDGDGDMDYSVAFDETTNMFTIFGSGEGSSNRNMEVEINPNFFRRAALAASHFYFGVYDSLSAVDNCTLILNNQENATLITANITESFNNDDNNDKLFHFSSRKFINFWSFAMGWKPGKVP